MIAALAACHTAKQTVREDASKSSVVSKKTTPKITTADVDKGWWGDTDYEGNPWVQNASKPYQITEGLQGRHLSIWASHGKYYNIGKQEWQWQRPQLFCTTEDLFTQTFVVPFIIPMLENAGATVFMPRERDWQANEVVIDNDYPQLYYCFNKEKKTIGAEQIREYQEEGKWKDCDSVGFGLPKEGELQDGDLPFTMGTARYTHTTKSKPTAYAYYSPDIKESGNYAVYVSYQTSPDAIDDAHYIVWHDDQMTEFRVNQQMGGGTWVYLGTFHFSADKSMLNCVMLDNHSHMKGVISTDAVRFGGGMGNIFRGAQLSGLPRCDEGARYYCEWAGAPYKYYSQRGGSDDYADDINARSLTTNWLAGGSCYVPDRKGLKVPIELSLAVHSDAGYNKDLKSIYGSLGIVTTDFNDHKLATGQSRDRSTQLMDTILYSVTKDMKALYGSWNVRDRYDRNYSETRLPAVPSTILETLSHQSFPDMKLAHDPLFKFNFSRAVYKAVARYMSNSHGKKCVIEPLAPINLRSTLSQDGKLTIAWDEQKDSLEPTSVPTSYVLYTAKGNAGFDNGTVINTTNAVVQMETDKVYRFRVSALNQGGESFKSEEIAAYYHPGARTILVANGFHRLASPQIVDRYVDKDTIGDKKIHELGFDMDSDPGLSYGRTAGWGGKQRVFSTAKLGEGPSAFGYSGIEMAGNFYAGNDFDYTTTHVKAIASSGKYSVVSCSSSTLNRYSLDNYPVLDVILGNERNDGYSLTPAKALTKQLMDITRTYKGALLMSGSYIGSDSQSDVEKKYLADVLHVTYVSQNRDGNETVKGMGKEFEVWRTLNETHYSSTASDVLASQGDAFAVLTYGDGTTAAVGYNKGTRNIYTMGFPFECIKDANVRNSIMQGILSFLLKN